MSTQTNNAYSIQKVADNLKRLGLPPDWDERTNRLLASIYRELVKGTPVNAATVDSLAAASGLDHEAGKEFVDGVSEKDEAGNVVGAVGLSRNEHSHKFEVDGVGLTTWCAWDTLFIAQALGKTANVTSYAPDSGSEVTLEISPTGVVANPVRAVVSVVMLDPSQIDMESLESVYMVFCHQIHFFPSREDAELWSAESESDFAILSVDDAFEVGSIAFADLIEVASRERSTSESTQSSRRNSEAQLDMCSGRTETGYRGVRKREATE